MKLKSKKKSAKLKPKENLSKIDYDFISNDEYEKLKKKQDLRISMLSETINIFENIEKEIEEFKNSSIERIEWEKYINLNGLPEPDVPSDVRSYITKIFFQNNERAENNFNWLLKINEKSLLTQDKLNKNYIRKYLNKKKVPLHIMYETDIEKLLKVYDSVTAILHEKSFYNNKCLHNEITKLKMEIREKIQNYHENFIFTILKNADGETEYYIYGSKLENNSLIRNYFRIINNISAKYDFSCNLFAMSIWTLRNIPITFHIIEESQLEIIMKPLKVHIYLPIKSIYNNATIYGLRTTYDHISDRSYTHKLINILSRNILNIKEILIKEWKDKILLEKDKREHLIKIREEYETKKALDEDKIKKEAKTNEKHGLTKIKKPQNKSKKSSSKQISEPVKIDSTQYLNIDKWFIENEDAKRINFLNYFKINLPNDNIINLREYIILGGIYELSFVEKPIQYYVQNQYMTVYKVPQYLRKINQFVTQRNLQSVNGAEDQYIQIIFELPNIVHSWMEPKICRFEKYANRKNKIIENTHQSKSKNYEKKSRFENSEKHIKLINADNLHFIIKRDLLPEMMSNYKFSDEIIREQLKSEQEAKTRKFIADKNYQNEEISFNNVHSSNEPSSFQYNEMEIKFDSNIDKDDIIIKTSPHALYTKLSTYPRNSVQIEKNNNFEKNENDKKMLSQLLDELRLARLKRENLLLSKEASKNKKFSKNNLDLVSKVEVHEEHNPQSFNQNNGTIINLNSKEGNNKNGELLGYWTNNGIYKSEYNENECKYTIWADTLGIFGFACKLYVHFPFQQWELRPDRTGSQRVSLDIKSLYITFNIEVSNDGYKIGLRESSRMQIVDFHKQFKTIREFKEVMRSNGYNIFPDEDAFLYIRDIDEKHNSIEIHSYNCLSQFCLSHKFCRSPLNKRAHNRIIYLKCGEYDAFDYAEILLKDIKITPDDANFVTIGESIADEFPTVIEHKSMKTTFQPDLFNLLQSTSSKHSRNIQLYTSILLKYNLSNLLKEIRLFSYS